MLKRITVSLTSLMLLAPNSLPLMADSVATSTTGSAVACTMEYAPVCGTNGRTYSNLCMANASGAQVLRNGACEPRKEVRQNNNVVINGKLEAMEAMTVPTLVKVKIERLNIATSSDSIKVGQTVAIKVTDKTEIVRKYNGKATLAEFAVGDVLHVNGQIGTDGVIEAKLLKDDSILKTEISAQAGVVKEVNVAGKYFVIGKMSDEQFDSEHFQGKFWGDSQGKMDEAKKQMEKMREENKKKMEKLKEEQKGKMDEAKNKMKQMKEDGKAQMKGLKEEQKKKMEEIKGKMKGRMDANKSFEMKKLQTALSGFISSAKGHAKTNNKETVDNKIEKNIENYKIQINDKTKITIGTTTVTLADIKVGDKVRVRGVANTVTKTLVAEMVTVLRFMPKIDIRSKMDVFSADRLNRASSTLKFDWNDKEKMGKPKMGMSDLPIVPRRGTSTGMMPLPWKPVRPSFIATSSTIIASSTATISTSTTGQ